MDRTRSLRTAASILLAGIVVLVLILVGPQSTEAVTVTVTPSVDSLASGSSITFDVTVVIQSNERIPISAQRLRVFSDSAGTTELTASPYSSPRTMTFVSATPILGYGYGYLYGYDETEGTGHSFGYGYGYGYGYGGSITLTYRATVDTTGWAVGEYFVKGEIDSGSHIYLSTVSSFIVAPDWDVNYDGCINIQDVTVVGQNWGATGAAHWIRSDVNRDGVINVQDVTLLGQHWQEGC